LIRGAACSGLVILAALLAGCPAPPEVNQLRALNDELQRRSVELTVQKLELEREIDRLRAELQKLREASGGIGEKTP
jgi:hypothetical protein